MSEPHVVDSDALADLKEKGGTWYAYRNEAMDSENHGVVIYLKVGQDCTHKTPPPHSPDTLHGLGWKYTLLGLVNLEDGTIAEEGAATDSKLECPICHGLGCMGCFFTHGELR